MFADKHEAKWIEHYKDLTVFNSELENEVVAEQIIGDPITIYKIESKLTGRCYVGHTTDPRWLEQHFRDIPNDALQEALQEEGEEQFKFEVLHQEVPITEVVYRVASEIDAHKNRALFNQSNPLHQSYSDRLLIEFFCDYFKICYEELLKRPSDIKNLADKIKDFEKMASNIDKAKREVNLDFVNINSIDDIINAIISSIGDLVVRAFAEKYEQKKIKANAIDFQDMIIYATYLLETHPDIRKNYCEKYQYVFVDEFQDISFADFRLIRLLPENLFAVGDDDQAIYGFRGGNSEIMQDFRKREDVKKYKITRNYRSTSIIVEHSKILIEHNLNRIRKKLHAKNMATYLPIKTLETRTIETLERTLLREFPEPICRTQFNHARVPIFENTLLEVDIETHTIGILVRYRSEVEKLRKFLVNDFKEIKEDDQRKEGDPFSFAGRGPGEIVEGGTIHSAKGKEYDKVILIHNTLEDKDFPFHDSDDINEDRRVFYVAMTRAKDELVILGGECQFVFESGLSTLLSKRRKHLERASKVLQSVIVKRIDIAKKQVNEVSEKLQAALTSILVKHIEHVTESTRKQYENDLGRLKQRVHRIKRASEDAARRLETELPPAIKASNENLLKELISVMDVFESQINSMPETSEVDNASFGFAELHQSLQDAHQQLLHFFDDHGLKPIEVPIGTVFNPSQHEEISPAIYADNIPTGRAAREERCGYLLHEQVIRKAQVVVSKGKNIRAPARLDRIVDIYLKRLIFAFQAKYKLNNIDQSLVKQEMVKYLLELGDESLWEIVSFSSKDKAEAIQLKRYTDYCAGQEKIHRCTDVFRGFWNKMWEVIKSLNENIKQADTFVSQNFAQPVRFVTYEGFHDLRNIKMFNDGVKGLDSQDEEVQLQHFNLLFVFPKGDMAVLKSHIKRRPTIADQKFQPLEIISERLHIADDTLKPLLVKKDSMELDDPDPTVQLVTRSGHVLNGHIWNFDEDFFYMNINKKDVIVYRAGILEFKNLIWIQIIKAYKSGAPISGHVTKRIRGGLQIKFRSLTGFLPISQVELYTIRQLDSYIGKTYEMMVIEINKTNNHFVLSRRTWLKEQRTKFLKSLSELSNESPKSRDITSRHRTVESIPGANQSPHIPQAQRISLDKSISLISPEPIEEVIDAPLSMSTSFRESLDTYVKDLKPETPRTVEVRRDLLYESIDLIIPKPIKKVVDSLFPMPKGFSGIPNSQIQNLTSETLEVEIGSNPSEKVNNNSQLTAQRSRDILKTHIQNLKPAILEPDITPEPPVAVNSNPQKTPQEYDDILLRQIQELKAEIYDPEKRGNIRQEPTSETEIDRETSFTPLNSSTVRDSDARQIKEQESPENRTGDPKKSLGDYLRRGGHFAVEKIRTTIFRKPRS